MKFKKHKFKGALSGLIAGILNGLLGAGGKTDIKLVKYDGVEATYDNIYSGKYPIYGYEHMFTNGQPTGTVKSFLDYMTSKEFASTITEKGYGDSSKMKS